MRVRLGQSLKQVGLWQPFGKRSIVGRLTVWYIVSSSILICFIISYLYWSLAKTLAVENVAILENRLQSIKTLLKNPNALKRVRGRVETEWPYWQFEKVFVRIIDDQNEILTETPNIPTEVVSEIFPKIDKIKKGNYSRYLGVVEQLPSPETPGGKLKVYIVLDLKHENGILLKYKQKLIYISILALFICVVISAKISESGFKPVQEIIETASNIKSTTLHERIPEDHLPVELKKLAATINEMLDRLGLSFQRLSQFSSDIAHELRTPVNNLRGELEVALGKERSREDYQEIIQSALEESLRLTRIIDSLLFLAQAENPKTQIKKENVRLEGELRKIIEFYEPMASEEGIKFELTQIPEIVLQVERTLFQRAVGNIISNAINYTPTGGIIRIETAAESDQVKIMITDNGEGISEEHLSKIFDRFYRSDASRTPSKLGGFGLGLSLVKSILRLHGGSVEIKSKVNEGTQAILTFMKGEA